MTYIVSYSKAHEAPREIGQFDSLAAALTAAEDAGAIVEDRSEIKKDRCFDVSGHEGDDNHGIWIERA